MGKASWEASVTGLGPRDVPERRKKKQRFSSVDSAADRTFSTLRNLDWEGLTDALEEQKYSQDEVSQGQCGKRHKSAVSCFSSKQIQTRC